MMTDHPTSAHVDLNALLHNIGCIQEHLRGRTQILAVVKANAYGHGIVSIARALASAGIRFFAVAFVDEGIELRQAGIRGDVLVMGGFMPEQVPALVEHRLTPVLFHHEQLEWLSTVVRRDPRPVPVHVKIDTGMGRLGLLPQEVLPFVRRLLDIKGLLLKGLMSHFADADLKSAQVVQEQINLFQKVYDELNGEGITAPQLHMANSAAILSLEQTWWGWVRPGIALYGYAPSSSLDDVLPLKPVLSLKSRIMHLRKVPAGTTISYGRTFTTHRESRIAVLPMGYADGYPRTLSNRGRVLVRGRRVPIVGRVCMDMLMLDVTDIPDVTLTEEVVLLGRQGNETISAVELAEQAGTIPYEILSAIGRRIPRIYTGQPAVS